MTDPPRAPQMPLPSAAVFAPARPLYPLGVRWTSATNHVDNYELHFQKLTDTTMSKVECGLSNYIPMKLETDSVYRMQVLGLSGGRLAATSNVLIIKLPPKTIREFWAQLPDNTSVWLGFTTNTPPGEQGFFKVNYREYPDFSP